MSINRFANTNGNVYAHSRGEAFFLDQLDHFIGQFGNSAHLTDADRDRLEEWIGWLKEYATSLQSILRSLPEEDHDKAFDQLFMFMSAAFGVGAVGTGASASAIQYLKASQAAGARRAKEPEQTRNNDLLKKAVEAAIEKSARAPAVSDDYARSIRSDVLAALPARLTKNGWPKESTIKKVVSSIRKGNSSRRTST